MNRVISAGTWTLALAWLSWLAGCAGHEDSAEAAEPELGEPETQDVVALPSEAPHAPDSSEQVPMESEAPPEPEDDPYRISVEIPVDDLRIADGENLAVGELLDERTAFRAADFHLRELVLIARSGDGGSVELILDAWQSGAVGIPSGADETWFEVRIPAVFRKIPIRIRRGWSTSPGPWTSTCSLRSSSRAPGLFPRCRRRSGKSPWTRPIRLRARPSTHRKW